MLFPISFKSDKTPLDAPHCISPVALVRGPYFLTKDYVVLNWTGGKLP